MSRARRRLAVGVVAVALALVVAGAVGLITRAEDPTGRLVAYLTFSGAFWAIAGAAHARLGQRHRP